MKPGRKPRMFCECGNPLDEEARRNTSIDRHILGCRRCRELEEARRELIKNGGVDEYDIPEYSVYLPIPAHSDKTIIHRIDFRLL